MNFMLITPDNDMQIKKIIKPIIFFFCDRIFIVEVGWQYFTIFVSNFTLFWDNFMTFALLKCTEM